MLDLKVFGESARGGVLRHRARAGEARQATGALAVLSLNVLFLVIGAAGTLLLQRRRRLRHGAPS
jgi:hypothetical protein